MLLTAPVFDSRNDQAGQTPCPPAPFASTLEVCACHIHEPFNPNMSEQKLRKTDCGPALRARSSTLPRGEARPGLLVGSWKMANQRPAQQNQP